MSSRSGSMAMANLSSAEKYLIQEAHEGFIEGLRSSVPLQDLSDFVLDETRLRQTLRLERRQILQEFIQQNSTLSKEKLSALLKELNAGLQKTIEENMEKNGRHKNHSLSFLEKLEDFLCERYRSWAEGKLAESPYAELESLEKYLENSKSVIVSHFENYWKPGNADFHLKRKSELEGKLENIQKEILEKQRMYLEGPVEEERKQFREMEWDVFEKLDRLNSYLRNLKLECIPKFLLERHLGEIEQFLEKKEVFQRKEYRKIHKDVMEKLAGTKMALYMAEGQHLAGNAVAAIMELCSQLKRCFHEMLQNLGNGSIAVKVKAKDFERPEPVVNRSTGENSGIDGVMETDGTGTRRTTVELETGGGQSAVKVQQSEANELDLTGNNIVLMRDGEGKRRHPMRDQIHENEFVTSKRSRFTPASPRLKSTPQLARPDSSVSTSKRSRFDRTSKSTPENSNSSNSKSSPIGTPKALQGTRWGKDGKEELSKKALTPPPKNKSVSFERDHDSRKSRKELFRNMEFFLTEAQTGVDPRLFGPPSTLHKYDLEILRKEIEVCGGKVLSQIGEEKGDNVICISDGYCRTIEYFYALAKGIPCVCNTWIRRCLALNEVVPWSAFILPSGWSVKRQEIIPMHSKKPLKDYRIQFLTSEKSDELLIYWKLFLLACEAQLPNCNRRKDQLIPNGTQIVVVGYHSKATKQLLHEAKSKKIPVVNPEWILQAIIVGERSKSYDHEGFKVLVEGDKGTEQIRETTADSVVISVAPNPDNQQQPSPSPKIKSEKFDSRKKRKSCTHHF